MFKTFVKFNFRVVLQKVIYCISLVAQMCPSSGIKRMVSESGDLIPLKRERFTFKGSHLAVLEQYYEQDPYPDAQVREMIVEECNKAAEKCGK